MMVPPNTVAAAAVDPSKRLRSTGCMREWMIAVPDNLGRPCAMERLGRTARQSATSDLGNPDTRLAACNSQNSRPNEGLSSCLWDYAESKASPESVNG